MVKTVLLSYFDMATKEFLQTRATVVDDSDHSVDYIPYDATEVLAPDKTTWPAHTYPVFNGTGWDTVPDYRGVTFYHHLTQETKEYGLGESPDTSLYTDVAPSGTGTEWNPRSGKWAITVESARYVKRKEIEEVYKNHLNSTINTGIRGRIVNTSSSTDVVIRFGSDEDRLKLSLIEAISAARPGSKDSFTYQTADGLVVELSASEIKTICEIQHMNFLNVNVKYFDIMTRLDLASTIEEINQITW